MKGSWFVTLNKANIPESSELNYDALIIIQKNGTTVAYLNIECAIN